MKAALKDLVASTLTSRPMSAVMSPLLRNRASIFLLHRFKDEASGLQGVHDPGFLRQCLEELRRHRVPVLSLDELVSRALANESIPRGAVAFTMDDGFWDQAEIGAELFLEYDIPATIFLITGLQDGLLWPWDDRLAYVYEHTRQQEIRCDIHGHPLEQSMRGDRHARRDAMRETRALLKTLAHDSVEPALRTLAAAADVEVPRTPPPAHRPMGWEVARKLEQRGIRFGPHTVSHGIVSRMDDATAEFELVNGWTRLRSELAEPLDIYGWPTGRSGDFGQRDIDIVKRHGFRAALATDDDYAVFAGSPQGDGLFSLRRFGFPGTRAEFLNCRSWVQRGKEVLTGYRRKAAV
jgi:peptidoglycan/xylan/chitin deacetylase (PgdA/CDA1 family)